MDFIVPLIEFGFIGVIVLLAITRRMPEVEREWLLRILFIAFGLRMFIATVFAALPESRIFQDDANGYEYMGLAMANYWHGAGPRVLPDIALGNYGYFYINAALYYVFGTYRAVGSHFNCVVGTVNIYLVYILSRRFFHVLVARRAALLVGFMPSMILWSAITLKDTVTTLLVVFTLLSCVRMKEKLTPKNLFYTLLPIVAIQPIRFYMLYFLALAVVGSLLFERGARIVTGVPKSLLAAGMMVVLLAVVGLSSGAQEGTQFLNLQQLNTFRHGMADTANSGFAVDADISTPGGALAFLPLGILYLLLGPFPWQFGSLRALFAAPETILWWFMFPSMIRGLSFAIRKRFATTSPVILFTFALIPGYALMHGNIGSAFRQRAQIFIFLFIFTALGQYAKKLKRVGAQPEMLLTSDGEAAG